MGWDTLGYEGRTFVATGPTVEQLTAFNGSPATTPIRVYAGASSADTLDGVASNVVAELVRTGAFQRKVLAVANTTGTGWVSAASPIPSSTSTTAIPRSPACRIRSCPAGPPSSPPRETPQQAGRVLMEKRYAAWAALPTGNRPRLLAFGESLGSFAGQAAFSGVQDMQGRLDGAVWSGTPNFTTLWTTLKDSRDPGSLERVPVIDDGADVRFANQPSGPPAQWPTLGCAPHYVYQQHATDPVVWWSPTLRRPNWLSEPAGRDVDPQSAGSRWSPSGRSPSTWCCPPGYRPGTATTTARNAWTPGSPCCNHPIGPTRTPNVWDIIAR